MGLRRPAHGASFVRLAYRTTRAEPALPHDAVAGALLIVPERLRDPDVLVVVAHGTSGFGRRCTPSRGPMSAPSRPARQLEGWMSVLPDYAGYGYGARPARWIGADDEASSIFDAIRAVYRLMPEGYRPKRVVLVGHSEGGHAVLAAQARARAENLPSEIVAVVASAPMWFPARLFARMITSDEPRADAGTRDLLWALYYFDGHAELEDGPGRGLEVIAPALRAGGSVMALEARLQSPRSRRFWPSLATVRTYSRPTGLEAPPRLRRGRRLFGRGGALDGTLRSRLAGARPEGRAGVLWLQGGHGTHVTLPRARCAMDQPHPVAAPKPRSSRSAATRRPPTWASSPSTWTTS